MTASSRSTADIRNQLDSFHLRLLKFTLQAEGAIKLPTFAGSTFRGAFGTMFRRLSCASHCEDARSCLLASSCAYARVFEGIPDVKDYSSPGEGGLPRPFVIHPPLTGSSPAVGAEDRAPAESKKDAGEIVSFHTVLIGNGMHHLPYFVLVWRELGLTGIGSERRRFRLQSVESPLSLDPEEDEPAGGRNPEGADGMAAGKSCLVYSSNDKVVHNRMASMTVGDVFSHNSRLRSLLEICKQKEGQQEGQKEKSSLRVELLTPARLKSGGEFLQIAPSFEVLFGALLRRLESLSFFYCGGSLQLDYQSMLAQAREVRIVRSELRWTKWERYSGRQKRSIPWGGLLGVVEYWGNFLLFLPFLALGELVGVGNNCTFGLGKYKVFIGSETC